MRFSPGEFSGSGEVNGNEFRAGLRSGIENIARLQKEFLEIKDNKEATKLLGEINDTLAARVNLDPKEIAGLIERASQFLESLNIPEESPTASGSDSASVEKVTRTGKDWAEGKERTGLMKEIEKMQELYRGWLATKEGLEKMTARIKGMAGVNSEIVSRFDQLQVVVSQNFENNAEFIKKCLIQMSEDYDKGNEKGIGVYEALQTNLKERLNSDRNIVYAWSKYFGIVE